MRTIDSPERSGPQRQPHFLGHDCRETGCLQASPKRVHNRAECTRLIARGLPSGDLLIAHACKMYGQRLGRARRGHVIEQEVQRVAGVFCDIDCRATSMHA